MTDRSRSPQSRLARVSLESSSDHTDSDGDSSPLSGSSDSSSSTSSSSSGAGPLERARWEVILVPKFKAMGCSLWVQRVLVRFPIVSKGFILPISSVCPFFLLWHIQLSGVVNLRTGDLRPHVILSAMQRLHVSGWGQRMASRAGSLAKFLQFHLIFTVTVSGECSLLHTHGWLSVLSQDVACRLLLLVPARHYRLLGWAEGPTISDVRLFLAYI